MRHEVNDLAQEEGVTLSLLEDAIEHLGPRLHVRACKDVGGHFVASEPAEDDAVEADLSVQRRQRL